MILKADRIAKIINANIPYKVSAKLCDTEIDTLLTDSRNLTYPESTLFFALSTLGNDGHKYISELYDKGVRHFVVDNTQHILDELYHDAMFMIVDDVLSSLQHLSIAVRNMFDIPVIGITGSKGKTVVKEQISMLLQSQGVNVVRSPRSYNSQIGVPLSIWEFTPESQIAVFEAGISQTGEMYTLEKIIQPTIGVFTCITDEHDDGFETTEQKITEKIKLFSECKRVYIKRDQNTDFIESLIAKSYSSCQVIVIDGDNKALASAVVNDSLLGLGSISNEKLPENFSVKTFVSQAMKNCIVVYDSFTYDNRSLLDSLNIASRHLTPGRTLTLIVPNLPADKESFYKIIERKGVNRVINAEENSKNLTISDFSNEVILIKDTPFLELDELRCTLEIPWHETVMEVDLGAVVDNYNFFRSHIRKETGIVAMVKASGYGIGSLELAKTLQAQGATYLAVAVIDEGVTLRQGGITMPIIVMNPISTNYYALFSNKIEPSVFSIGELELLIENAERFGIFDYPVHIKLDTGMHRLGFLSDELVQLIDCLKNQKQLKVASIFSHLATADSLDQDEYTQSQLSLYESMSSELASALPYPIKRHVLNTAGILRYPQYQYDMVRLGIGLYGVSPVDGFNLRPVARLVSSIISIKQWNEGITIGYGRRGMIDKPTVVATIPIGYADGLNRHLSCGNAWVLVNGKKCKIVGNICMDQCMIDVTDANAKLGDTVEIFGPEAQITRISDTLKTIPYEVLTSVSERVKRIYIRE